MSKKQDATSSSDKVDEELMALVRQVKKEKEREKRLMK